MSALVDPDSLGAADIYQRAGESQGLLGDPAAGLALIDKAIEIYETHPASLELARALAAASGSSSHWGGSPRPCGGRARRRGQLEPPRPCRVPVDALGPGDAHRRTGRHRPRTRTHPRGADIELAGAAPTGLIINAFAHAFILGWPAHPRTTWPKPGSLASKPLPHGGSRPSTCRSSATTWPIRGVAVARCNARRTSSTPSPQGENRPWTDGPITPNVPSSTCCEAGPMRPSPGSRSSGHAEPAHLEPDGGPRPSHMSEAVVRWAPAGTRPPACNVG